MECLKDEPNDPTRWPACVAKANKTIVEEVTQCVKDEKNITEPVPVTAELAYNGDDCNADPRGSCTNASWFPGGGKMAFFGDETCSSDFLNACKSTEGPIIGPACILSL